MAGTIVDRLRVRAAAFGENAAIVDGERRISYAELFDRVDRLSAAFAAHGLRKGDAVLAFLPNGHEVVECELAAFASGLAWITLTSRLTWAEVRGVVAACRPKLVITSEDGARRIEEGTRELPLTEPELPEVWLTGAAFEARLAAHLPVPPRVRVEEEDVARLRYTSGTTGTAKAAVLPHRVYHAILDNLLHELPPLTSADRALHAAPLSHGSGALVYPILFAGGTNYLTVHFDPEEVLAAVEARRITTLFVVPTMLSRLVASMAHGTWDLSSLRALIYGGAPMPRGQLEAAVARVGSALVHIYGMSEAPWPITMLHPAEHRLDGPHLSSVGRPTPGCELRVVDSAGRSLPEGEVGEIQIRGRNVMSCYHEDPDGTRAVLREEWLSSGDLGRIDEEGYVFVVGRKKDVVISGGFNVYPAEVEAALSSHEAVLEAAVVGLPHDDWGEIVAAVVVLKPGASLTKPDVDAAVRKLLSGYKCPKRIEFASDLPKTATGKVQKTEIVRRLREGK